MDKDLHNGEAFEEHFANLPLPNEEQSWQKMKALLDKEDRDRKRPFFLLPNCAGWGLMALLVVAGFWFAWQQFDSEEKTIAGKQPAVPANANTQQPSPVQQQKASSDNKSATAQQKETLQPDSDASTTIDQKLVPVSTLPQSTNPGDQQNSLPVRQQNVVKGNRSFTNTAIVPRSNSASGNISNGTLKSNGEASIKLDNPINDTTAIQPRKQSSTEMIEPGLVKRDSVLQTRGVKDSLQASAPKDSTALVDTALVVTQPSPEKKNKTWIVSAGIGLQQRIPFNGQSSVPYDYYGRKSSLSDYIPSVYLKWERKDKWFLMGEFRYGAPQSVQEFSYSRRTKYDTATNALTTTTLRLKKTYYHQLPLSFNYYLTPNWSVGAGGIYSRFYGAIGEQEVKSKSLLTQQETVTRQLNRIHNFTDSFLYKTQVHFLVQTDVHWKRFNLGVRYARDLQPYIRYTRPDGIVNSRKNQSLQVILRYKIFER